MKKSWREMEAYVNDELAIDTLTVNGVKFIKLESREKHR